MKYSTLFPEYLKNDVYGARPTYMNIIHLTTEVEEPQAYYTYFNKFELFSFRKYKLVDWRHRRYKR